jgi:serine/threonine protein phosphatase PrpC
MHNGNTYHNLATSNKLLREFQAEANLASIALRTQAQKYGGNTEQQQGGTPSNGVTSYMAGGGADTQSKSRKNLLLAKEASFTPRDDSVNGSRPRSNRDFSELLGGAQIPRSVQQSETPKLFSTSLSRKIATPSTSRHGFFNGAGNGMPTGSRTTRNDERGTGSIPPSGTSRGGPGMGAVGKPPMSTSTAFSAAERRKKEEDQKIEEGVRFYRALMNKNVSYGNGNGSAGTRSNAGSHDRSGNGIELPGFRERTQKMQQFAKNLDGSSMNLGTSAAALGTRGKPNALPGEQSTQREYFPGARTQRNVDQGQHGLTDRALFSPAKEKPMSGTTANGSLTQRGRGNEERSELNDLLGISQGNEEETPLPSYTMTNFRLGKKENGLAEALRDVTMPNHEPSKCSSRHNGHVKAFAANTNQGLVRNYNEDRVSIILNIVKPPNRAHETWPKCCFFGVYDGHGGATCADFLRDSLHQYIIKDASFPSNPREALKNGFEAAEQQFLEYAQNMNDHSGSCALVLLIVGDMCYVANVGDSRAIMSGDGGKKVFPLSRDHKPLDELEHKRIIENGGKIYQSQIPTTDVFKENSYVLGPHRVLPGRLSVQHHCCLWLTDCVGFPNFW